MRAGMTRRGEPSGKGGVGWEGWDGKGGVSSSCLAVVLTSLMPITSAVSDSHLAALHLVFDKHVAKATSIVDGQGVSCFVGKESGRTVYQVRGKEDALYTVFPEHYCSCHSFFYDIVSKSEGLCCKHQIAVLLSDAAGKTKKSKVPDLVIAELLEAA